MLSETHRDLVVRSSDFRWKNLHGSVHFELLFYIWYITKKKEEKLAISSWNQKFESQMKSELETRSSQLVDDADSKNYEYSIFIYFLLKLVFLSSASMKLKGNKILKNMFM